MLMNKTCPQCKNSLDFSAFGWDLEVGNLGLLENRILDLEKFKESVEKILKL